MTNGATPAPVADPTPPQLRREFVAGGQRYAGQYRYRALPGAIDDLTVVLGDDLYERMQRDSQVRANLTVLTAAVLEDGVHLSPAVTDAEADGYEQATEIVQTAERMFDDLETALSDSLRDMVSGAYALGNRVAEEVYAYDATYTGRQQLVLRRLTVKPRTAIAFVVDPYMNLLGLLGATPENPVVNRSFRVDPSKILPRSKFAILSHAPVNNDPRGTSILESAYFPWNVKQQVWDEYLKYLALYANPSLAGFLPENAKGQKQTDGSMTNPLDDLLATLLAFSGGTATALPFGAKLQTIEAGGDGSPFERAFDICNRAITVGILTQTRATMEAEHGSKADSVTAQDVLGTLVRQGKQAVTRMMRRDILRQWVIVNYGLAAVPLTPRVSLGSVEEEDKTPRMNAFTNLYKVGGAFPSQLPAVHQEYGLPPADPAELAAASARFMQGPAPIIPPDDEDDEDGDAQ